MIAWMALYANDRDVIEDLLYRRLKTLWSDCTDALAIFSQHRVGTEFCGQKVWEALLSAFPINHKRMQTVIANLAASWPGMANPRLTSIATSAMSATLCKC